MLCFISFPFYRVWWNDFMAAVLQWNTRVHLELLLFLTGVSCFLCRMKPSDITWTASFLPSFPFSFLSFPPLRVPLRMWPAALNLRLHVYSMFRFQLQISFCRSVCSSHFTSTFWSLSELCIFGWKWSEKDVNISFLTHWHNSCTFDSDHFLIVCCYSLQFAAI